MLPVFEIPEEEAIEALRIYGSGKWGFGTLPTQIEYLLEITALIWLGRTEPRHLPEFKIDYYKALAEAQSSLKKTRQQNAKKAREAKAKKTASSQDEFNRQLEQLRSKPKEVVG
ncbi:hypothetical protein F4813DRAFT_175443 [Daldinia decipiens]|uniref:uncharacterized protein n=1 Tax=Daldinia decipiens TaxID=326647 RepID=UPI0020C5720A|nr:uncharacterized protein F4813DRAFT_175443 [Daldinia decipiens]KAI1661869.1 hypothetical protein F4813DRAFT_175443 [Daldinia decipiens]